MYTTHVPREGPHMIENLCANTQTGPRRAALGLLGAVIAMAMICFALAASPAHAHTVDLSGSAASYFGCGKRLTSSASYVASSNRIVGTTRLTNDCQLTGFHGTVVVLL